MSTKALKSDAETRITFLKILYRSSAYAICAYFVSYMLEKVLVVGGALIQGFSTDMRYNYTKVTADISSWDQESVLLIYLVPFFIQALIFIILYIRFMNMEHKSHYVKIFILWLLFFILYRLLGLFPGHIFFRTGIYYALNWLYAGIIFKMVTVGIAAGLFLFTGFQILRGIIALSGTYHYHIRDMGIPNLILSSLVIPVLLVSVVVSAFYLPGLPGEEIIGLIMIVGLNIFILFKMSGLDPNHFSFKEKVTEKRNPGWILGFSLIAVIALRIILDMGISG
jgi:hypothetical protein